MGEKPDIETLFKNESLKLNSWEEWKFQENEEVRNETEVITCTTQVYHNLT